MPSSRVGTTYRQRIVQRLPLGLMVLLGIVVAQPLVRFGSDRGGVWWLIPVAAFVVWVALTAYVGAWLNAGERARARRERHRPPRPGHSAAPEN